MPNTLFEKIWEAHEVADGLIYIDLHLVHEVTSPQAFDGLRLAGRNVRRPDRTLATADHNTPTDGTPVAARIKDELSRVQVETLERNCQEFGVPVYSLGSQRQGIVHVIGPELGVSQPGMTIVCGDSHTSTHGAFGALAFGIGTSEVEHVLATQCMVQQRPRSMRILYDGQLGFGVTAKDLILATLGQLGVGGMTGHAVEYAGPAIEALSMEGRMTVCNMTIEGGGRGGMIAPDDTTFAWFQRADELGWPGGRPGAPTGAELDAAVERWAELRTEDGATFDREERVDAAAISPRSPGAPTPAWSGPSPTRSPPRRSSTAPPTARPPNGRSTTWRSSPAPPSRTSPSTACSSAPAPTRASATCAPPPSSSPGARSRRPSAPWSSPAPSRSRPRPRPRGSTASSATPASTGASPAAPCASA